MFASPHPESFLPTVQEVDPCSPALPPPSHMPTHGPTVDMARGGGGLPSCTRQLLERLFVECKESLVQIPGFDKRLLCGGRGQIGT